MTRAQPLIDLTEQYRALKPQIDAAIQAVCARSDFILGREVRLFEQECAAYLGVRDTVSVASGTDALVIALESCGIGAGDEVITAPFTFIATAEAVRRVGARVVFADIDPATCVIDPRAIERAITRRTRALLPVHLFGQPAALDRLRAIARSRGLRMIEDCAQSFGAVYQGVKAGAWGDASAFSFFPGKNLGAYGDGGLIASDSSRVIALARMLRNHGQRARYRHDRPGYNSRLDTIQAAVLRVKLPYIDEWNAKRRRIARIYDKGLCALGYRVFHQAPGTLTAMNYYSFDAGTARGRLARFCARHGISTNIYYPRPLHLQKAFADAGYHRGDFPVSEALARRILALPMYPELKPRDAERVVAIIARFT